MEEHGRPQRRPWETMVCQGPPAAARATGKVGDHGGARETTEETMGDHGVPGTAGCGKGNRQGGRPQKWETTGDHSVPETAANGKGNQQGVPEGSFCGISLT